MSKREERTIKFIKIEKTNGQEFIKFISRKFKNQAVLDKGFKTLKENEYILFPLVDNDEMINHLIELIGSKFFFKIITKKGIYVNNYKYKNIKEALENNIPSKFLDLIPKSYDIIGNIAILEFDKFELLEAQKLKAIKSNQITVRR